jgi:serine/threonine-protein kinase
MPRLVHLKEGMRLEDRYKLTHQLGSGAMAEVWAARDRLSGDRVAVKVISELMALSSQAHKRFEREMQAIGSIHHTNVVALLDHGQVQDGRPFLVMELVEGESLAEYLQKHSLIGVFSALMLTSQILDGLEAAHSKGIIHRDLKPANILLAYLGSGRRRVKILDFGVAHILDLTASTNERLTGTGSILGSPHYMPMEVARGSYKIDIRADIFGVGAILYHTLCGVPPFQGQGLGQLLTKIYAHDIPPLTDRRVDLPGGLIRCVDRALGHTPKERYDSATQMREVVDGLLEEVRQDREERTKETETSGI